MPTIVAGLITAAIFVGFHYVDILPTVRMMLLFVSGCGAAVMIGSIFISVWNWAGGATAGWLPWQIGVAVGLLPTLYAITAAIICGYHFKRKEKPNKTVQWLAFGIPLALLLVTGGVVGTVGDKLTGSVDAGSNKVNTELIGTGGSGPLPAVKKHHHHGGD